MVLFAFFAAILSSIAYGSEVSQIYTSGDPVPHIGYQTIQTVESSQLEELSSDELEDFADVLSERLKLQLGELKAKAEGSFPGCSEGFDYLRGLNSLGQYERCLELADSCMGKVTSETERDLLWQGGVCAWNNFEFKRAYDLFNYVTAPEFQGDSEFAGRVFFFAQFANFTQYESETEAILTRHLPWKASVEKVVGIVKRLKKGHAKEISQEETKAFILENIEAKRSLLTETLVSSWAHYLYRYMNATDEALTFLKENTNRVLNPESWVSTAYASLYHQRSPHFVLARKVYDAFAADEHVHSWYPLERNTYTYTELYNSICKGNLLQDQAYDQFTHIKSMWRAGAIDTSEALRQARRLDQNYSNKSDLLSFIAGLYVAEGDDNRAMSYYWKSHNNCRYFNRNHWGLFNIFRRKRSRAFDDYQKNLDKIADSLRGVEFSNKLTSYVVNWLSLSETSKERVKYSLRYFAPYIDELYNFGGRVYIKQAYELLSEAPDLGNLRDVRINSGTYVLDNRLWDDVRGLGGHDMVVSDLGETRGAPFGAYNLAAHEVAHQFHQLANDSVSSCIARLYEAAKLRGLFPDPYAASNDHEYFAQGVVYFLIPKDAPQRFGLNVEWLVENDPDLYQLLKNIANASTIDRISCPI